MCLYYTACMKRCHRELIIALEKVIAVCSRCLNGALHLLRQIEHTSIIAHSSEVDVGRIFFFTLLAFLVINPEDCYPGCHFPRFTCKLSVKGSDRTTHSLLLFICLFIYLFFYMLDHWFSSRGLSKLSMGELSIHFLFPLKNQCSHFL